MTVIADSQSFRDIAQKLDRAKARLWSINIFYGLGRFLVVLFVAMVLAAGLDLIFGLGSVGRLLVAVVLVGTVFYVFIRRFMKAIITEPVAEEVARHVEMAYPELGNRVINALQFAKEEQVTSKYMIDMAIEESAQQSAMFDFRKAFDLKPLKHVCLCSLIALVVLALFVGCCNYFVQPGAFYSSLMRVAFPFMDKPPIGFVKIESLSPDDNIDVLAGDDVGFELKISGRKSAGAEAYLQCLYKNGVKKKIRMSSMGADTDGTGAGAVRVFQCRVENVQNSFDFFASCQGAETLRYTATVMEPPVVKKIDLTLAYPAYTGLKAESEEDSRGNIRAVIGTMAEVTVEANRSLKRAWLNFNGANDSYMEKGEDGRFWKGKFEITDNGFYTINLEDERGNTNKDPYRRTIMAIPDQAPGVMIQSPVDKSEFPLGARVKIVTRAKDDFGLSSVVIMIRVGAEGAEQTLKTFEPETLQKSVTIVGEFILKADKYKNGDIVFYQATATDNFPGTPHTSTSALYALKVVDKKALLDERMKNYRDWRSQVMEILRRQKEARKEIDRITTKTLMGLIRQRAKSIFDAQSKMRGMTLALASVMQTDNRHERLVRDSLFGIADGEMKSIIKNLHAMARVDVPTEITEAHGKIVTDMDQVIKVLQAILNVTERLESETKEKLERDEGEDLPTEAEEMLEKLAEELKKFVKEQKAVIEASEELAKKPLEDLTEEDKAKLDELAAIEDDWAKFMNEAYTSLSTLPEQDFTNSSLLSELLEVYSEVELAKDAIKKNAVKIAVPHEQLGAELAESLTTHLEKWLTDTPDREAWSQEEPLEQYETPMAELPDELEDIIGDLLTEEEDMFEDAEDVSSSWGDSLDKGAGWDAADGPISNYSAQGVTGNRMPNSHEVGGRAGQGRSGKSGGEMVENSANNKGGRRTPTRLTNTPFSEGVVDDKSTEAIGGATGGGKESGSGGEGLEGPVPKSVQKLMGQLAERQAAIRNKAERIKANFRQVNFQTRDWEDIIKNMRDVEEAFKTGRYSAAMRKRRVILGNLKGTQQMLAGEVEVRKDKTAGMSKKTADEIMNARTMSGAPAGYETFLREYYEAIKKEKQPTKAEEKPTPKKAA